MTVYLVKRFTRNNDDTLITVCSSLELAQKCIEFPSRDFITSYEVDGGPDSEVLVQNVVIQYRYR